MAERKKLSVVVLLCSTWLTFIQDVASLRFNKTINMSNMIILRWHREDGQSLQTHNSNKLWQNTKSESPSHGHSTNISSVTFCICSSAQRTASTFFFWKNLWTHKHFIERMKSEKWKFSDERKSFKLKISYEIRTTESRYGGSAQSLKKNRWALLLDMNTNLFSKKKSRFLLHCLDCFDLTALSV